MNSNLIQSILSILIAHGASVENATRHYWTALHLAAHSGHVETIKLLLKYKACIDVQNQFGQTPLMMACAEDSGFLSYFVFT